mgnify:CR=1 FL=1
MDLGHAAVPVGAQLRGDDGQARLHKLSLGVVVIEIELLDQPQFAGLTCRLVLHEPTRLNNFARPSCVTGRGRR